MKNRNILIALGFLSAAGVLLLASGCGGNKTEKNASPIAVNAPEWVNRGGGGDKKDADGTKYFYGVGMAQGIQNRALAVDTADARARAKIAETISTCISKLTKDYLASTTAGDMTKSAEEQNVTETLKSFTQMTLSGVTIVDHWKDPSDGTLFAFARLDVENMKKMLDQAKELDSKVRDFVRANADKAFDDLSAEEAKVK